MIVSWSPTAPPASMPESILLETGDIVRHHPWWEARAALTIRLLQGMGIRPGARVLDAGCGWGVTLEALERHEYHVTGLDGNRLALEKLDRPDRLLVQADLGKPLAPLGEPFDAVLGLDVIEHIDEDRVAVANLAALTRVGGVAILSVPALPYLYSEFDQVQGHRRRYQPDTLREAFGGSGLRLERILWWGASMVVPFWFGRRRRRRKTGTPADLYRQYLALPRQPMLGILRVMLALDNALTVRKAAPIGTSLFAIARRLRPDAPALAAARPQSAGAGWK